MPSHDDFVGSHYDPEERTKPDSFDRLRPETLTANDRSAPSRRRTPRRLSFGCEAVLGFAEYALDYNLSGVRRGLSRVLMAALGAPDPIAPDPLTVYAFAISAFPALVEEWTVALAVTVESHVGGRKACYTITDREHNVALRIVHGAVVAVRPLTSVRRSKRATD